MERVVPNPDNILYANGSAQLNPDYPTNVKNVNTPAPRIVGTSIGEHGDITIKLSNGVSVTVSVKASD